MKRIYEIFSFFKLNSKNFFDLKFSFINRFIKKYFAIQHDII